MKAMQCRYPIHGNDGVMEKWKSFERNQMYCFFKYYALGIRHELQDTEAMLDIFSGYDSVLTKYKKMMAEVEKSGNSESGALSPRSRAKSVKMYVDGLRERFKNGIESGLRNGGKEEENHEITDSVNAEHNFSDEYMYGDDEKEEMETNVDSLTSTLSDDGDHEKSDKVVSGQSG